MHLIKGLVQDYQLRQTSEKGWRVQRSKCNYNNIQDEDTGPSTSVYNNDNYLSKEFRQKKEDINKIMVVLYLRT